MLAPRFRWLVLSLMGFGLVAAGLSGCSATPVPIPGGPDSGTTILADAGARDATGSRDGTLFPDMAVTPMADASGGDAAPSDAMPSDAEAGAGDAEAGAGDAEAGLDDADTSDADLMLDDAEPDTVVGGGDL